MTRDVIIYLGGFELPDRNAAAQRVRANAAIFAELGYEVVLIGRNSHADLTSQSLTSVQHPGIELDCWESARPNSGREWLRYITAVGPLRELISNRYQHRVHSIICYNYPAIAQVRVGALAKRVGAVALADVTEWYAPVKARSVSAVMKNLDTTLRMRFANRRMHHLITISSYLTKYYSDDFDDIVELPTLIEHQPTDLSGLETPHRGRKRLFYGGSVIDGSAGKMDRHQLKDRLDWMVELLGEVKQAGDDFIFDIYGVEQKDYLAVVPEHTPLLLRLGDSVQFHGRRPRRELIGALRAADYSFFLRSRTRTNLAGFPTKFSESISLGTPVLTNVLENIEPYATEGENFEPISYQDFDASVARIRACLNAQPEEILRRKRLCRESGMFHPLSYVEDVQGLFPRLR